MKKQRAVVVKLLMWEIGKNLPNSEKEFDCTCIYIEDTIRELKELDNNNSKSDNEEDVIVQVRRVTMGVTLCRGPNNYPLNETFTTLIPALIMGNTVVFKPAKYGVLFIKPLLTLFKDCFPKGVINIIYGKGRELEPTRAQVILRNYIPNQIDLGVCLDWMQRILPLYYQILILKTLLVNV